jgi:4-hydroxy-3-polyprenylbenzoate decarboxylase/2,5-furandicarboxylate decarboxylase 1
MQMPFQDFRQFLDVLRQHGELIDINRPIALNDVGKAMKQSYVRNGPAIMFNNNGTDYPMVAGVYSNREKALLAFEADENTIQEKVLHGLDNPIPPVMAKGAAPCHEEIIEGDAIDIRNFPVPQYSPKDGGPYITPGIVVSEDPETGVPDVGHYRFLIHGVVFGAAISPLRQASRQVQEARHRAESSANHRRRSDHRLHLSGAGAGHHRRLGARRRFARRTDRARKMQDL